MIDLETLKPVRPEIESFQLKQPQYVFDESVLDLEMLGPIDQITGSVSYSTVSGERAEVYRHWIR